MATTFETAVPDLKSPSLAERFAAWVTNASKPVQMSRMTHALAELNDEQLATVGLKRSEISAHAYRVVYEGA